MDGLKAKDTNPESFILHVSVTFSFLLCTSFSLKGSGSNNTATADSACSSQAETLILLIFQGADRATSVGCKCSIALTSTPETAALWAQDDI